MTGDLLQIGLSNLCLSLPLALAAWAVQRRARRPALAHLLWLVVLVKLITPPLWVVPVVPVADPRATPAGAEAPVEAGGRPAPAPLVPRVEAGGEAGRDPEAETPFLAEYGYTVMGLLWLLGSAGVLLVTLLRAFRFNRWLWRVAEPAPRELQGVVEELAGRLGLRRTPILYTVSARISPLVWWVGGEVRLLVPVSLVARMEGASLRWILAHEVAHVKRRDHLVRWLEAASCVLFWWNPVAWWACRNLRVNEEICCDQLVVTCFKPKPRAYATALFTVVEYLSAPIVRPPATASAITSGGELKRRFKMIVTGKPVRTTPRWLRGILVAGVLGLAPLGVVYAQEPNFEAVAERLVEAVKERELTPGQAAAMMGELARRHFEQRLHRALAEAEEKERECGEAGVEAHFHKLGVKEEHFDALREALAKHGLGGRRADEVLEVILKSVQLMHKQGGTPRFSGDLTHYLLHEMDLNEKQVGLVKGIATKILHLNRKERVRDEGARERKYREIERRLHRLVEKGELSPKEAKRKLVAVRRELTHGAREKGEDSPEAALKSRWLRYEKQVWTAVKAGRLSKREAMEKLEQYKQKLHQEGERRRDRSPEARRDEARAYEVRIKKAVAAGRLTVAQARRKLQAYTKQLHQAQRKLQTYKKQLHRGEDPRRSEREGVRRQPGREEMARVKEKIWAAVKSGRITREDAEKRWQAYLESLERRAKRRL